MKITLSEYETKDYIIFILYGLLMISLSWNIFGLKILPIIVIPIGVLLGHLIASFKVIK